MIASSRSLGFSALVLAVALVACGGDSPTSSGGGGGGPDPAPTDTLRPPDPGLSYTLGCLAALPIENCLGGNLAPDAIQSIRDPQWFTVEDADYLADGDRVFGMEAGGRFYAFPRKIMNWHEAVTFNVLGDSGETLFRTTASWCPLTFSFIEWRNPNWKNPANGRASSFGISGSLLDNNLVMYDRETRTTWSQIMGLGLAGPHAGACLEMGRHSVDTTWKIWRTLHPGTLVLTNTPSLPSPFNPDNYNINPYATYWAGRVKPPEKITFPDHRVPDQRVVVAVHGRDGSAAVLVGGRDTGRTTVGGTPVVFLMDPVSETIFAFENNIEGKARSFIASAPGEDGLPRFRDTDSGTVWSLDGIGLSGPLAGKRMAQVPAFRVYWFAWASLFPGTEVKSL